MIRHMRWSRFAVLLLLAGCAGGQQCTLIGCVSQLTVRLPPGVTAGQACVAGVCTSSVVDGSLRVPLGRRADGDTVQVTLTLPGAATPYEGEVPVVRTRPNGEGCPPDCVNGEAAVDTSTRRVVPAAG